MSYEVRAKRYKKRTTSYKLWVSYKVQDTSYEQRDKRFKIEPASTDDGMVHSLHHSMRPAQYLDRISWLSDIWKYSPCQNQLIVRHLKVQSLSESAEYQTSESTVPVIPYYQKPAHARFLNWSYGAIINRIKWYRPVSFEVIVVNMKPVFRFSCDSVPLKLKKRGGYLFYQYSLFELSTPL